MEHTIYQVDAFTDTLFTGNPAAIIPLKEWLPDAVMQKIAAENNLSETAYFIETPDGPYLRWFTPTLEIDLCGHATLATSFVYLTILHPEKSSVTFKTNVAGDLTITKDGDYLTMDFPARCGQPVSLDSIPPSVFDALSQKRPIAAYQARDLMLVYEDEQIIRDITPDFETLKKHDRWIIVTAPSKEFNFVSRFFCADDVVMEDPVTGSAHCTSVPYWANKLGQTKLKARQLSERGGDLMCELKGERVFLSGKAVLYMKGTIYAP